MMATTSIINANVASGASVSSAVCLYPVDGRRWALFCPSMSGNTLRLEFSTVSGGASDFGALHPAADQNAIITSCTVRPAWTSFVPPTPFCRASLGAAVTDTASVFLLPLTAR